MLCILLLTLHQVNCMLSRCLRYTSAASGTLRRFSENVTPVVVSESKPSSFSLCRDCWQVAGQAFGIYFATCIMGGSALSLYDNKLSNNARWYDHLVIHSINGLVVPLAPPMLIVSALQRERDEYMQRKKITYNSTKKQ